MKAMPRPETINAMQATIMASSMLLSKLGELIDKHELEMDAETMNWFEKWQAASTLYEKCVDAEIARGNG